MLEAASSPSQLCGWSKLVAFEPTQLLACVVPCPLDPLMLAMPPMLGMLLVLLVPPLLLDCLYPCGCLWVMFARLLATCLLYELFD